MQLTKNFHAREFECKCGCNFGTNPGDMSSIVVQWLQDIRDYMNLPLFCVFRRPNGTYASAGSGCRCHAHNLKVGGTRGSYHTIGMAADVWGPPAHLIYDHALRVIPPSTGGIILYKRRGFVHIDGRYQAFREVRG